MKGCTMNDKKTISPKVKLALDMIQNKEMTNQEYTNFYINASKYEHITDYEREVLTEKLAAILRTKFPKQSARMLGNKSTLAQELLEEVMVELKKDFDFSSNQVGSHVKVGGSMIGGREFIAWYVSYKNSKGWNCSLTYRQKTPEDAPYLEVHHRQVTKNTEFKPEKKNYPVEMRKQALEDYKNYLINIVE